MKSYSRIVTCLFALAVIAGCASTEVSNRKILVDEKLPRPGHIWVYDFAATPADVPAESALAGKHDEHPTPQTAEQIATGRQVGAQIAVQLVDEIRGMGLPAVRASSKTMPEVNNIVIRGYLLSVDEGSATKRVAIGFDSGGFRVDGVGGRLPDDGSGLRKLGSGTAQSGGGKAPGRRWGLSASLPQPTRLDSSSAAG